MNCFNKLLTREFHRPEMNRRWVRGGSINSLIYSPYYPENVSIFLSWLNSLFVDNTSIEYLPINSRPLTIPTLLTEETSTRRQKHRNRKDGLMSANQTNFVCILNLPHDNISSSMQGLNHWWIRKLGTNETPLYRSFLVACLRSARWCVEWFTGKYRRCANTST